MSLIAYLVIDTKRLSLLSEPGALWRLINNLHEIRLIGSKEKAQVMIDVIVRVNIAASAGLVFAGSRSLQTEIRG